jgi:hypothetical protein
VPFVPGQLKVWDPRGYMWCTPGDSYEIFQLRVGKGDTLGRITRAVTPLAVTAAERDAAIARIKKSFEQFPDASLDFSKIPKVKPPLMALDLDDRGNLWVRRTIADTTKATYDVFDATGKQIATADLPWRLSTYFRLVFRGDTVYGVTRDEDDVPYVVRGRISR